MVLLVIRLREMRINCDDSRDLNQIYDENLVLFSYGI